MSDQRGSDEEFQKAIFIIAALLFSPIAVILVLWWITKTLGPLLWLLLALGVAAAGVYAWHRFKTAPPSVRSAHETEILEQIARAEKQQRSLPHNIAATAIDGALTANGVVLDRKALAEVSAIANRLYAHEFLSPLPPMPTVPTEAERVYDIEYDRRTLRKGEEPPYRLRTDDRGRPTSVPLLAFEAWLHDYLASTVNPEATLALFVTAFTETVVQATTGATLVSRTRGSFSVPLLDMLPDARKAMADAIDVAYARRVKQWHHLSSVRAVYERNRKRASDTMLRVRDLNAGEVLDIRSFGGSPRETLDTYLTGSPLHDLFLVSVPFAIPYEKRFEGQLVVARQGSGKTNALECLIYNDLAEVAAGRASLVVMDSQGLSQDALLGRLAKLAHFAPGGPLADRLIYLEPDIDWPLALNIFDIGIRDIQRMSAREREEIITSACDVIEFLFTGLLGGELSDNMTMLYRYLVPAMLAIPDADMNTFIELLDTGSERNAPPAWQAKYGRYFTVLDRDIRTFLDTDYLRDPELIKTKAAVRRRLRAALADTNFRRMFTQPRNKLDLFTELQAGKVVLVNTFAAGNYVEQFGRLILALLMQATHRRLALDREDRTPTFVYIDECQDYVSREDRIARYIDKCRKQNVALIFTTQRLGTIESAKVLNALKGTPIKLAGGSDADADELATMLHTEADHIRGLPRGSFCAHVSGVTTQGIDIMFEESPLKALPRVGDQAFEAMRAQMRSDYAVRFGEDRDASHSYADFSEAKVIAAPQLPKPLTGSEDDKDDDYDPLL